MKKQKTMALMGAAVMAASMMAAAGMPVMAAGTNYSTTIGGTLTTTFDKYLVMDKQANVPNASFTYEVTAGQAKSYSVDGKKFEILAGVDADKVTMAGVGTDEDNTITYKPYDITSDTANSLIKDYDPDTEKYALKTATLDFSACRFTEPGVYRYVITESNVINQAVTNDADATRIVDVYVYDASEGDVKKLTIAGYVLHSADNDSPDVTMDTDGDYGSAGEYTAKKFQGFTNDYDTSDLTFRKEVSGNQASHDKYFAFTVNITDAVPGTVYDVDITGADATSGSNTATIAENTEQSNVTKLVADKNGTVTQKFYLQHGQEVKIQGIAKDTKYEVTENAEDYKSTAAGVNGYGAAVSGIIASDDLKTSYLNTRDGVIPTGVVMAVAPFAAVTLIGGFGAATILMKKKKKDGDAE